MHRKEKNEKLDIYTVLMLPLMTMFLLNIGLVATTWAWYTASVSTGVNTITAGPQLEVTVTKGTAPVEKTNGKYVLDPGNYTVTCQPGSSITGYVVLMDIEDGNTTGTSATILDLFFTPVNAEGTTKKFFVELTNPNMKTVNINVSSEKTLSISSLWIENKEGFLTDISENQGYQLITEEGINLCSTSYTINLLDENGTALKQSEVNNSVSTFSENTTEDQPAVITKQDTELTEITIPVIEGYELVSVNGTEPKKSYQLTEGQDNVFNAVYKKIEEIHDAPAQEDPVIQPTDPSSDIEIGTDPSSEEISGGGEKTTTVEQEPTTPAQEPQSEETNPTLEEERVEGQSDTDAAGEEAEGQSDVNVGEEEQSGAEEQIEEDTPIEQN